MPTLKLLPAVITIMSYVPKDECNLKEPLSVVKVYILEKSSCLTLGLGNIDRIPFKKKFEVKYKE